MEGVERRIFNTAPLLKKHDIDLSIINIGCQGRVGLLLQNQGINVINLNLCVKE